MIKLNGTEIVIDKFPDGTLHFADSCGMDKHSGWTCADIEWYFESNEEMVSLMFIVKHLRAHDVQIARLTMPYIPNARQDRVKSSADVFTLKWFADFINYLGFNEVRVLDPHSSVSEALFNNLRVQNPSHYIMKAITKIGCIKEDTNKNLIAFYPDEGAMKRYSGLIPLEYAFGIKRRDWKTGKIEGIDVAGSVDAIKNSSIIIIDDISSRGGTFYFSAKKLKELGASHIYLYITHCEKTIFEGEVFKSGLIDKVYTTNSIFNAKVQEYGVSLGLKDKFEVFEYEKY